MAWMSQQEARGLGGPSGVSTGGSLMEALTVQLP